MEPLILSHLEDAESGWWVRILKDVQYNRRSVSSSSLSRTNTRASAQGAGERRLCAAAHNKMWNLRSIPYVSGAVHGARQTLSIHAFSPLQSITAVITVSATMRPTFTKKFNGSVWHTKPIHQQIYRASQSAASWSVAHHRCYCSGSMRMKECWTQMSFFFWGWTPWTKHVWCEWKKPLNINERHRYDRGTSNQWFKKGGKLWKIGCKMDSNI